MTTNTSMVGLNTKEICALSIKEGLPSYRGKQLSHWIYGQGVRSFAEMTDLPGTLRTRLESRFNIGRSAIAAQQHSRDGTIKLLLQMVDGETVETVGLPYEDRLSCCVSTQVGCPVSCTFCATGQGGYIRNLTAGEIIDQVLAVQEVMNTRLTPLTSPRFRVDHVVLMGMGEPLLNYDAALKAIHLMNEELSIGARHITLSTAGVVPGIYRLMQEKLQITLAISLHAADDRLRRRLIPGMAKWSIQEIITACRDYTKQTGRRVTVEYCLLGGINDSAQEAQELAVLLKGWITHVNLIPYNPVSGLPYRAPLSQRINAFTKILQDAKIQVTQRLQRGEDINAACGQLRRRIGNARSATKYEK
jgi:23S rRNA (adenine2503-C2)-methyltransferase